MKIALTKWLINDLSGFCPSDVVEAAQADMIFEASSDLRMHLMKQFLETDEAKKVANCTVVVTKHLFSTVCDIPEKKRDAKVVIAPPVSSTFIA